MKPFSKQFANFTALLSGRVCTLRDVNMIQHQYHRKPANDMLFGTVCLDGTHKNTAPKFDIRTCILMFQGTPKHPVCAVPPLTTDLLGTGPLLQSFLRKPSNASGIFLSGHVHVREV